LKIGFDSSPSIIGIGRKTKRRRFSKGTPILNLNVLQNIEVKNWGNFAESASFGLPLNADDAWTRTKSNLQYYRGNYLLIAGFILAITVYFRPSLVWVIAATAGSSVGLFLAPNLVIQGHRVVNTEKFAIVVLVLVIVVWATETANSIYTATFFFSTSFCCS